MPQEVMKHFFAAKFSEDKSLEMNIEIELPHNQKDSISR